MLWIHGHASPALDAAFMFSWLLGTLWFCGPLVLLVAARHLRRGERREAAAWLLVAMGASFVPELLKALVQRPRPTLWPWLIPTFGGEPVQLTFGPDAVRGVHFSPVRNELIFSMDRGGDEHPAEGGSEVDTSEVDAGERLKRSGVAASPLPRMVSGKMSFSSTLPNVPRVQV